VEVERVLGGALEDEVGTGEEQANPRVLLVDDDQEARLLMRSLLEGEGYEIQEAVDGHQAMDTLKVNPEFSLVILDLRMPGMDGREVLKLIRGSVDTAALPVLIRTGVGTPKDEAELLEAGADDFITKSVDSARFLARVKAIIRRSLL
jgi:DNA-binding response OmpR family regulator